MLHATAAACGNVLTPCRSRQPSLPVHQGRCPIERRVYYMYNICYFMVATSCAFGFEGRNQPRLSSAPWWCLAILAPRYLSCYMRNDPGWKYV
jgi:hypothetical protein